MLRRSVYLVGAHASGKTTLARMIAEFYKTPLITETARMVTSAMEVGVDAMRANLALVDRCQRAIFARQIEEEERYAAAPYVSDRGFDNVAYAAEHASLGVAAELVRSKAFADQVERMRRATVILVRPHTLVGTATDGVRERYDWDGMVRIDGMLMLLLELNSVPYVSLGTASIKERWLTVRRLLDNEVT